MTDLRPTYNNELIGLISILAVLNEHKKMSMGKALLILPLISHRNTLKTLNNKRVKIRSFEEFIVKYPSNFSNFNERFFSLITVSINSSILLCRMNLISIEGGSLILSEENKFDFEEMTLGNRAKDVIAGAEVISQLLKEDTHNLYLQLRVEL